jgi:hypothetical protein
MIFQIALWATIVGLVLFFMVRGTEPSDGFSALIAWLIIAPLPLAGLLTGLLALLTAY